MRYKITNKTNCWIKYAKITFAPLETKELELESIYEHLDFNIEKIEETEQKKQLKGGKKLDVKY